MPSYFVYPRTTFIRRVRLQGMDGLGEMLYLTIKYDNSEWFAPSTIKYDNSEWFAPSTPSHPELAPGDVMRNGTTSGSLLLQLSSDIRPRRHVRCLAAV